MPTFDDPRKGATEASEALRGLAHATRSFADPADTYAVIGELLAGARSLRQVLDQLAGAHLNHRARAHDDHGDQAAGATSALAAADELHEAGTLLDAVHERLDAAMSHSGRIAWHPVGPALEASAPERTSARAGELALTLWPDAPLGEHQRYAYRIEDTETGQSVEGRDLFTGAGARVEPGRALRELAGYLAASGAARQYALDNPGTHPENETLFPEPIAETARRNYAALTMLAELDPGTADPPQPGRAETGPRWISVVFLQGEEADQALDLIEGFGTDAAIDHLAGYDDGEDTVQAALANGYVYDTPPAGALERTATKDVYTLTYSPFLGHVSLLREYDAPPDPTLQGLDTPEPMTHRAGQAAARTARQTRRESEQADWFARPRQASPAGRGLSL